MHAMERGRREPGVCNSRLARCATLAGMAERTRPFYGLDARLPPVTTVLLGLQHVLAMFVGIITPPILVGTALGLPVADVSFLVSMSLFTSGLNTFMQVSRVGPVGSGLLSVQGTSFVFVGLAIQTGKAGGLPLVFGMSLVLSTVPMLISRFIGPARRLFPPVVTGSVVMLIGISLIQVGFTEFAGGHGAKDFGSLANLGLGALVMNIIVLVHAFGPPAMSTLSIAIGLVTGYLVAALLGRVDFAAVEQASWLSVPQPLRYGMAFDPHFLLPWCIAYVITAIECIGDLSATSAVSREPVQGEVFIRRLEGGVLADGIGCTITSFFNAMPKTTFAQNNGVIAMTGVAARSVGVAVAVMLSLLGLFPKLAAVVAVMPRPVLGGATVIMFAMVAVAGLHLVVAERFGGREQFILAITLGLGLGVTMVPAAVASVGDFPEAPPLLRSALDGLRIILQSGLAVGAITATILNLLLKPETSEGGH